MNAGSPEAGWFADLKGEDLSGVTFVRDYVQLQFNPLPTLDVYTPITVINSAGRFARPSRDFANALIEQVDKYVEDIRVSVGQSVEIIFRDRSIVSFSLRQADYVGPEAFAFFSRDGGVWAY